MEQLITSLRGVKVGYSITNIEVTETIVFLHGFTGSSKTWEPVIKHLPTSIRCIAVDLLGHGKTESPKQSERYQMREQIIDLHTLLNSLHISDFTLVGYSMGGRIALAYALTYPDHVKRLVLESASPGIQSVDEQQTRIKADESLANKIDHEGLDAFIDFWQDIPLFQSQQNLPEIKRQAIRQERLQQSVLGLVNSLKGMGTGRQPSYWSHLSKLNMPVIFITGEFDQKFHMIAQQMTKSIASSQHIEVLGVGHAIHVENPVQFATIIMEQMK
ncbi:2-succinyl-6-hydroxy-2,4-cyclohexadiene-1-carboxylate synthase [Paenisporosarcina sp.]|uniref:2-succinyl-6-hydroxy-2, 4-cyclohexadiene-1-carboxylate synthase n=1 Tax=Paenisporosarcina sp. TaxID=1932001 RepID=UPI003C770941